ncbi:hypothetical protein A4H97_19370 [Niastella yeongjuensis]|uniref:TonB-dependent receptor plug domain-containing protein n=1 Tax=Niastella yeongjuensis TaxID=354355 RepID=A0A1V9DYE9_9BACT|nr:SusC/RagA family TonB-linked outer membrane protein [Niastella yeongjuensis]OQP38870.1 hypothetical protein A4H97_19370 [Niastella yeongjuensis]SEO29615.1 TonB-linked outer membrane protein, SusC/RagA family [Niastella yeongjuensis]
MKNLRPGIGIRALFCLKLSLALILIFCLQAAAKGYSQTDPRITFTVKDAKISEALLTIERKSSFRIIYSEFDLPATSHITLSVKNELLSEVLKKMLSVYKLKFRILENKAVIISQEQANNRVDQISQVTEQLPAVITVNGKVTDSKGQPLANVSVKVKDSQLGTLTDDQGNFNLRFPDELPHALIISSVGFASQEIKVKDGQTLSIVLETAAGDLNEVVIVGYGKQKRNAVTSSISSVKGEAITKAPVANISNTLGGRVSGVLSRQSSGAPGEDNDQINIRGIGTTGNASPLVIVNGIPMDYNQLNPNEIETITVLKDAAAVAPYGLAGANGVILVTTKRGKEGKFSLNYDGYYGYQKTANMPTFLDAYGYASMLNEANLNSGNPAAYTPEQLQKYKDGSDPDHFPNTDWVKRIISPSSPITRHSLSLTGGAEKVRFYANLGYLFQEGVVSPIYFKRYNATVNIDANVTNTTIASFDLNGSLSNRNNPSGASGSSIYSNITEYPPILPLQFSNGLPAHELLPQIYESGYNRENLKNLNAKLTIEQKIPFVKGLSLKGAFAWFGGDTTDKIWTKPVTFYGLDATNQYIPKTAGPATGSTLYQGLTQLQRTVLQGYITYDRTFGKHAVNALAVYEKQDATLANFSAKRGAYSVNLDELSSGSSNKNDYDNNGFSGRSAQVGYVYQVNYGYNNKYLVGFSGRYNGHYYFAPGKRFAFFPAASVGWVLSEENFIRDQFNWINNLKVRASYGKAGNLAGNPFQYLTSYGLRNSYVFGSTTPTQVQGVYENAQANPNITWETAKKANIGLDALLWKGKLGFTIDVFSERRTDMLIKPNAVVPVEYGIDISQQNAGIMENKGIELSVNTAHSFSNGIKLDAAFNFSYARNKLIQTFESASTYNNPNTRTTGRPYKAQFGLQGLGLFQQSDFEADGKTLKTGIPKPTFGPVYPGDIRYADLAGAPDADGKPTGPDGKIDINDYTMIGQPLFPQIIYGLNLNVSWKGFDLSTLWQGAGKASLYLNNELAFPFYNGAKVFTEQTDYWTPENTGAKYPRLTSNPSTNSTQASSFWIRSGNYLRLKTAELGYSLPASVMRMLKIRSVRVFVSGQNLFTFSKFNYLDPELGSDRGRYYFQQKVYSFGMNVGF